MFGVLEDDGTEKIVMAHQVILSLYSTVFKQLFSGSRKKSRKLNAKEDESFVELAKIYEVDDDGMATVILKDTPYKSFKFFINLLYGDETIASCKKTYRLVDCIKLATKYKINDICDELKARLMHVLVINPDTVLDALDVINQLSHVKDCEDVCQQVGRHCVTVVAIKGHLTSGSDVCAFWRRKKSNPVAFEYLWQESEFHAHCAQLLQAEFSTRNRERSKS